MYDEVNNFKALCFFKRDQILEEELKQNDIDHELKQNVMYQKNAATDRIIPHNADTPLITLFCFLDS